MSAVSLRLFRHHLSLGCAAAILGSTVGLYAAPSFAQFEEILVTARKKEELLQDVPVAVTAFTGNDFLNAGLLEFQDIQRLTPNFTVQPSAAAGEVFANITIRGQRGGFITLNADQAVGIYVNGAPITRGTSVYSGLFDIERVEVLKGPQGTLYGKNTTGGAINVLTRGPELNEISGYGEINVGNFDRLDYEAVINAPLGDTAAIRVGGKRTTRDGFGRGELTDAVLSDDDEVFLKASLLWKPSEEVSLRINADYHEIDEGGTIFRPRITVLGGFLAQMVDDPDIYVGKDFPGYVPFTGGDEFNINATLTYQMDWAEFVSITSYREQFAELGFQTSAITEVELAQDSSIFAQEMRLSGDAVGGKLSWQTGLFYASENGQDEDFLPGIGSFEVTEATNKTYAAFGQISYQALEKLAVRLGVRYTYEERELEDLEPGSPILFGEADFDRVQWTVGLDYQPIDNLLLYATVTEGFRSGAIDQEALDQVVNPEIVLNYELGIKSEFLDNIRFNAAAFYSDYTDIQRTIIDPSGAGLTTIFSNAGSAEIYGFEAELYASPVEGLDIGLTAGYTKAEYKEFIDGELDRSNDAFDIPEWQFSAFGRYEYPVAPDSTLGVQLNYFYQGVTDFSQVDTISAGTELNQVDAYGIFNGQIDYAFEWMGENTVALYATNILQKEYFVTGFVGNVFNNVISNGIVGTPRTFGVRFRKGF